MTPQEIADKSAQAMWESDEASKWFGMAIEKVAPGYALMSLIIEAHHCNGHGDCHGGVSFALADSAFGFACNSYNELCVGQHTMMSYLRPVSKGDILSAEAQERNREGKSGIYDVTVRNQDGKICAEMRGFSRRVKGTLY
ncbi:MAG: acyl-CoA thioesterase [Paracoccaceae bacterium]|jgi:acyl-CoA thioesterase